MQSDNKPPGIVCLATVVALLCIESAPRAVAAPADSASPGNAPVALPSAPVPVVAPTATPGAATPTPAATPDNAQDKAAARQNMVREQRAAGLRLFLVSRGLTEKPTQDAIIEYLEKQEQARERLLASGSKLMLALGKTGTAALPEAQLGDLVAQYQTALNEAKSQKEKAQAELEERIKFSKNPRLKGVLLVLGGINEAPPLSSFWNVPGTTPAPNR
jgi:hypothetical protein